MKKIILPALALLGGCDGIPLAPDRGPAFKTSSIVTVFARTQDVTLLFSSGETAPASFQARFYASTSRDPQAQMDGAILVVSAADGPMPLIGGESLEIEILRATINSGGMVLFDGTGTVTTDRVVVDQYPITGSARLENGTLDIGGVDYTITSHSARFPTWEVHFEALTRISGF